MNRTRKSSIDHYYQDFIHDLIRYNIITRKRATFYSLVSYESMRVKTKHIEENLNNN
jgi:hypothetical protein